MSPFGMKIENFKSLKGLMRAFSDVVHAIRILCRDRILHRDVSFRNILLHEHKGVLRGLLIDYDYAVSLDRVFSDTIGERTGTLPFMAIDRLRAVPKFLHSYFHDLESLFYVLCWICTLYAGPCDKKRTFFKVTFPYRGTTIAVWNGDISGQNTMVAICNSKIAFALAPDGLENTIKQFSEYFRPIEECLELLRELLFVSAFGNVKDLGKKAQKKLELEKELKDGEPSERAFIIERFNEIPIHMRPHDIVLDSFTLAFKEMEDKLPQDETIPVEEVEEEVELSYVGPRRVRDFVENVVPNAAVDVKGGFNEKGTQEGLDVQRHTEEHEDDAGSHPSPSASGSRSNTQSSPNKRKSTDIPEGAPSSPKRSKSLVTPRTSRTIVTYARRKGNQTRSTGRGSNDVHFFARPSGTGSRSSAVQDGNITEEGDATCMDASESS